jgi:hypothetical protein
MGSAQTTRRTIRAAQERRRALWLSCGMLVMAGLATAMVFARAPNTPQTTGSIPGSELRTARIITTTDDGCSQQQVFDNQTGRMTKVSQPCDAVVYDRNGVPISSTPAPNRFDAISKAFSGQR